MKECFLHNFIPALLIVASIVIAMHYCTLGSCPVTIAYGPCQTGKSTAILIALSLIGKLKHL